MTIVWQNPRKVVRTQEHYSRMPDIAPNQHVYCSNRTGHRLIVQSNRMPVSVQRMEKTLDQLMTDVDMITARSRARKMLSELKMAYDSLRIGQHGIVKDELRRMSKEV